MKNWISGSSFETVLQNAMQDVPLEERENLPVGIVMLEADGTLSSLHVPMTEDNSEDVVSSMMAMEYILYAFDRQDWMAEFVVETTKIKDSVLEKRAVDRRSNLTLIHGGKKDEEG